MIVSHDLAYSRSHQAYVSVVPSGAAIVATCSWIVSLRVSLRSTFLARLGLFVNTVPRFITTVVVVLSRILEDLLLGAVGLLLTSDSVPVNFSGNLTHSIHRSTSHGLQFSTAERRIGFRKLAHGYHVLSRRMMEGSSWESERLANGSLWEHMNPQWSAAVFMRIRCDCAPWQCFHWYPGDKVLIGLGAYVTHSRCDHAMRCGCPAWLHR